MKMNNPNAVQPCDIALTDEPQYATFKEWLEAAIDFADKRIKESEPGTTNNQVWCTEWQILKVVQRRAELYCVLDSEPQAEGYGLMCNIQCYVRDLGNGIDSLLTRMNIEECLVDHADFQDVCNSHSWLMMVAPNDKSQWHPKVTSLMQFIDMQILVKSGDESDGGQG